VDHAKAVRNHCVSEFCELTGKGLTHAIILRCFTGIETQVLQNNNVTVAQSRNCFGSYVTNRIACKRDRSFQKLLQSQSDRAEAVLVVRFAVGATKMADDNHACTLLNKCEKRGDRCADATVVGYQTVSQWNVKVTTNDHPFASEVAEVTQRA
jgi:hypothetical protein